MGGTASKVSTSYVQADEFPSRHPNVRTIPQYMEICANEMPNKEAVAFVSTNSPREAVTFKTLYDKSKKVANNLIRLGIKRGDVVAINLRTCPEFLYATFGAIMAGALPLSASFTYTDGSDLVALMERLQTCTCIVLDPGADNEKWNILNNLLDSHDINGHVKSTQMPTLRHLITFDPSNVLKCGLDFGMLLNEIEDSASQLPDMDENEIAILFQTSGSTGVPKIIANNHTSMLVSMNFASPVFSADDVVFNERPFSWKGGFPFDLFVGATRVTVSGFCPPPEDKTDFLIDAVSREGCTVMGGLPSVFHQIKKRKDKRMVLLKTILIGGQPITKHTISSLRGLSENIIVIYGTTESWTITNCTISDPDTFIEHGCGYPDNGVELKIVDNEENTVPLNTTGEIYMKSKLLFTEYFNDPSKTAAALTHVGWFRTDDLGRVLDDGMVIVEGRKSNMIISGGMNVSPEILEKVLVTCPGIQSCAIVPIPDDVMYQVLCVCVKLEPGSDVDESVLRKFCEDAHADKHGLFTVLPTYYLFMDAFPETNTGKVSRPGLTSLAVNTFKTTE